MQPGALVIYCSIGAMPRDGGPGWNREPLDGGVLGVMEAKCLG